MSKQNDNVHVIETTDLSEIKEATDEKIHLWLHSLVTHLKQEQLVVSMSRKKVDVTEPIVQYQNGRWWTGRYIGEIQYQGRTLRIKPRYEAALRKWIACIWNIRMLPQQGTQMSVNLWLWVLMARIWENKFVQAAKHGLPYVRGEEQHVGQTIRGRLDVRKTAALLRSGQQAVASRTGVRRLDVQIGAILLAAFGRLQAELAHLPQTWLSDRSKDLLRQLGTQVKKADMQKSLKDKSPIKYRPITEIYRPAVEMSWSILQQRPFGSSADGEKQVTGVLIDMAEIWEMYVYHLLRAGLPQLNILHEGRRTEPLDSLYRNEQQNTLGGLKPDIVVQDRKTGRMLGIIDAKYKKTTSNVHRPHGVLREDLYQIHAYQGAFSTSNDPFHVALVYPFDQDGQIGQLQSDSPWQLNGHPEKKLWFFGLSTDDPDSDHFSASEEQLIKHINEWRPH